MSYSFTVVADTKAEVMKKVAETFDNIVISQPIHASDRAAAIAAAGAFVGLLAEPHDGDEISLSMHGSLSWAHEVPDEFLGSSVGVSAILRNKVIA